MSPLHLIFQAASEGVNLEIFIIVFNSIENGLKCVYMGNLLHILCARIVNSKTYNSDVSFRRQLGYGECIQSNMNKGTEVL